VKFRQLLSTLSQTKYEKEQKQKESETETSAPLQSPPPTKNPLIHWMMY
jgi:hypothetical protein